MARSTKGSANPDIFISYAREDSATAQRLVAALEQRGWSVFIDRQTPIGPRFDRHISEQLRAARCVVVLWSAASIESEWVIEEAADAKKRDVLAPVRLQDVDPPFGFGHRNYADLFGWVDRRPHGGFDQLLARITELAGSPATTPEIPEAYRDWLRRTYARVDLLGQEQDTSHAFQLDHVYVPALTSPAPRADLAQDRELEKGEERRLVPVLQRLNDESLIMLAQAGAGKTTFCRWAALRSVAGDDLAHPVPAPEAFTEPAPIDLRDRLPVLVPFREFAPNTDWGRGGRTWARSNLEAALAAWVDGAIGDLSGELLTAHLGAGTAFLLLDGIDELPEVTSRAGATVYPRELVLSGLADALPRWLEAGNRVLLTSRPAGMERAGLHRLGLDQAPLEPLPKELQDLFVRRWFHTLGKADSAPSLIATIRDREDLAPLVENPMLLTALCILHDSGGRLPEDRYRLYRRIVDNVLVNRFPGGPRETEPIKARLEAIALCMHEGDVAEPRQSPAPEVGFGEVEHALRVIADEGWCEEDRRVEPAIRRDELLEKSGLLLPRPNQRAAFYHLSFQEYLASERLLRFSDDLEAVIRERSATPEWRLTLLFLFAGKVEAARPDWGSRLLGHLIETQPRLAVEANPAPAVFIAEALDLILAKRRPVPPAVKDGFIRLALDAIEDEVALPARLALGMTLGRIGDPRIPDLRDPGAYALVPAGRYPFGDDGVTVEIAEPFRIARYPVTNSQYQAFMEDGGYRDRQWWSEPGWAWLQKAGARERMSWRDSRFNGPTQPVVGVCFWEAEACAAWAGGRLPREEEWEAAARGPEGHAYPWGDDWQDGICNTREAGLGATSPVGLFPGSRQRPLALEDMAGNVFEWCASLYDEKKRDDGPRVLRGGSWLGSQVNARCANRNWYDPGDRFYYVGFRVVCSSPS
jgi:hypothetical protein